MPNLETLTEDDVRNLVKSSNFRKAKSYVNKVKHQLRVGNTLTADVSDSQTHGVEIDVTPNDIFAHCSCPYDWEIYCKHVAAVLLRWIKEPVSFNSKRPARGSLPGYPIQVRPVGPPATRRPKDLPNWLTSPFEERRQVDYSSLESLLEQVKLQYLRSIAKKRGWKTRGTKKSAIVQQIIELMTDPADVSRALHTLNEEHMQVLRALLLLDNKDGVDEKHLEQVSQHWGELKSHKKIATYIRHLTERGLAFSIDTDDFTPSDNSLIPRSIGRQFPPLLQDVIPNSKDLQSDRPTNTLRFADPNSLVQIATKITQMLEEESVSLRNPMPRPHLEKFHSELKKWDYDPEELLKAHQKKMLRSYSNLTLSVPPPNPPLPDEAMNKLGAVAGDKAKLEFIFLLLVTTGLFQPGSPVTVWTEVKEEFLHQTPSQQWAILVRTFFEMENWSTLWIMLRENPELQLRRNYNRSYFKPKNLYNELSRFRQLILRVLSCLPNYKWIVITDLLDLMQTVWPKFDGTTWERHFYVRQKPSWFLGKANQIEPLDTTIKSNWNVAQGRFIQHFITGPLYWLGLTDLSFDQDELVAFRLHGLTNLYWDRVETPAIATKTINQSADLASSDQNFLTHGYNITVDPEAISTEAHSLLDKIARLDVVDSEKFIYKLDPQAVHHSFEEGLILTEVVSEWERLFEDTMPNSIRTTLTTWWNTYGQIRVYDDVTIIEFGDDYALAEMKEATSLEEHLIAELSPRLVLISQRSVSTLTAELEKAGYTPTQTDEV